MWTLPALECIAEAVEIVPRDGSIERFANRCRGTELKWSGRGLVQNPEPFQDLATGTPECGAQKKLRHTSHGPMGGLLPGGKLKGTRPRTAR